ncbi:hypothetical protein D3C71_1649180 [compost metagenome]
MTVGEGADDVEQPPAIAEGFGAAIGVYGDVVPGGHDFAVFGLARVETRADVRVGTGKNQQGFGAVAQVFPLWIGFGQMPVQRAVRALFAMQQHRHMTGLQAAFAVGHQYGETGGEDQFMQLGQLVDGKSARRIHGDIFLGECLHPRQAIGLL